MSKGEKNIASSSGCAMTRRILDPGFAIPLLLMDVHIYEQEEVVDTTSILNSYSITAIKKANSGSVL